MFGAADSPFVARLAARMSNETPDDALALATAASLDDRGWSSVATALSEKHPEHAIQAAEHVRNPQWRVGVWLVLLKAAQARQASLTVLRAKVATEANAIAARVVVEKHPSERATGYISVAGYLLRAGVNPEPYLRKARAEIARVRAPLLRADLLRTLEELKK